MHGYALRTGAAGRASIKGLRSGGWVMVMVFVVGMVG